MDMILEEEIELDEGFSITSDDLADWAIRKIAHNNEETARVVSIGERQIKEITEKVKAMEDKNNRDNAFLISKLAEFFKTVKHDETDTMEKYKLFSGVLKMRKPKIKPVAPKDDELTEWLLSNGFEVYVDTIKKPKWGEFKKGLDFSTGKAVVKSTGEVVDIVQFEEVEQSFSVEVK